MKFTALVVLASAAFVAAQETTTSAAATTTDATATTTAANSITATAPVAPTGAPGTSGVPGATVISVLNQMPECTFGCLAALFTDPQSLCTASEESVTSFFNCAATVCPSDALASTVQFALSPIPQACLADFPSLAGSAGTELVDAARAGTATSDAAFATVSSLRSVTLRPTSARALTTTSAAAKTTGSVTASAAATTGGANATTTTKTSSGGKAVAWGSAVAIVVGFAGLVLA
ncbi:hypothetical protein HDU96_003266 [Phlyctochytrium bullatum]|nr:hypothetical protein HDU96_003266 [Phlyctochytrium bullatum]